MIASVRAYYYRTAWLMSILMRIKVKTCSPSIYMLCLLDRLARFACSIKIVYVICMELFASPNGSSFSSQSMPVAVDHTDSVSWLSNVEAVI